MGKASLADLLIDCEGKEEIASVSPVDVRWVAEYVKALLAHLDAHAHEIMRLQGDVAGLREIIAGSHAVRCTCGDHMRSTDGRWDIRDPRCIDLQSMASPPSTPGKESGR